MQPIHFVLIKFIWFVQKMVVNTTFSGPDDLLGNGFMYLLYIGSVRFLALERHQMAQPPKSPLPQTKRVAIGVELHVPIGRLIGENMNFYAN
jgi:hypothetical protein